MTSSLRFRSRVLGAVAIAALAACNTVHETKTGTLTLPVDPSVAPAQAMIGGRPVARMVGESGITMDFFLGELVVATDDRAKVDAFAARWGGSVVSSTERLNDVPAMHRVKLDPSPAVVAEILAKVNGNAPELKGTFTSSSDAAAKLIAVAIEEANADGIMVTPNFVVAPQGISTGTTTEASTGDDPGYSTNAFDWPYMNRGSAQDIGVGAAWQMMERAGVFTNKVKIMVLDGGFSQTDPDLPVSRSIVGDWEVPNAMSCSDGSSCPFHGSWVTGAAMGRLDDGKGGAGPAAPVGELLAVPFETDFFALLSTVERIVGATIFGAPKIINISSGFELDLGWEVAVEAACLFTCPAPGQMASSITASVRASNKLIFAAAGNAGKDVDNGGQNPEGSLFIPCELSGVICVGGMDHDMTTLAAQSNFGSKDDDDSVDIYGPWATWVGPTPDAPADHASLRAGTSMSSPFVAGVAAMVWASKPSLTADGVWAVLHDTAHVGGVHSHGGSQRRINAFGAIASILGGAPPTISLNHAASAPVKREFAVTAVVGDDGHVCPPTSCPLTWDPAPARVVGNTAFFRFDSAGTKTITATTHDVADQPASATISVPADDTPPVVTITAPAPGASVPQGVEVQFLALASDMNDGPDPGPGPLACQWTSSNVADGPPFDCDDTITFPTTGTRTLTVSTTSSTGQIATASVTVTVTAPPTNFPPSVTLGNVPTPNYNNDGLAWDTPIVLNIAASDPEGDTPLTYVWKATSFRPDSATVFATATLATTQNLSWTPSSTPALFGDFAALGNACYDGQTLRITVEVSDSLGHTTTKTFPDLKIYRCILI